MYSLENAYGLVVGIANYHQIRPLPATVLEDARDIVDLLVDPQFCAYKFGNVKLLLDEAATQAGLREALAELAGRTNPDSTVFFYVSSHGGRIDAGPCAGEYLLPIDADWTSDDSLADSALSGAELTKALSAVAARKFVVVFDCCHAGGIGEPKDAHASAIRPLSPRFYDALKEGRGRVILASSRDTESSWVLPGAKNSLFTHHLLAGLRGNAPGPGGVIRIFDLFHYVQPLVTQDQPAQHPIFKAELEENFALCLYLGGKSPVPTPTAFPSDGLSYDVFISYRQQEPDRTWVRNALVPALKAQGVRVLIDYEGFRLGVPLVLEMERGVEESRFTLAILSPAYLNSNFTEMENVLAEHLGLENSERRLLAVMRENCKPRLGIRARLWLDMTDDKEFDVNVARLVHEFRQI